MKTSMHTLRTVCLGALLCLAGCSVQALPVAPPVGQAVASGSKSPEDRAAETSTRRDLENQASQRQAKVIAEAYTALQATHRALDFLLQGREKPAITSIEKASRKLRVVLNREPGLALAPVACTSITRDVLATTADVTRVVEKTQQLLKQGHLQAARKLLSDLASETVITVTSLPLQTYPDALDLASHKAKQGDLAAAADILRSALATQVVTEVTVPLPVLRAQHSLEAAEKLVEKTGRTPEENEKLKNLLDSAEKSARFAEALGYGGTSDLGTCFREIERIREKSADGNAEKGLFKRILSKLRSLAGR